MFQPNDNFQSGSVPSPYIVLNQQPRQQDRFPISFNYRIVFIFGILKCAIGFLEFTIGIVNIFAVNYFTSPIAFPIWCGLTIWCNGLFGIILKWKRTKCLIATFFALSISALVLTLLMMIFYSWTLNYYAKGGDNICGYGYHPYPYWRYDCYQVLSAVQQANGRGLLGFLMILIIIEAVCSIGSVVVSCKAYSKCCNTCDANDCCTCLGCCECGCHPLNTEQNHASVNSHGVNHSNVVGSNAQSWNPLSNYSNPCSALVNVFIQFPDGPHLFSSANHNADGTTPQNITVQICSANEQGRNDQQLQQQGGMNQSSSNPMYNSMPV